MSVLADAFVLARKDLIVELRARRAMAAATALAGIAFILVGLAVGPDAGRLRSLAPGLVWIVLLYATLAVAERLEQIDREDDAFSGLWLAVEDSRAIYLGRVMSVATVLTLLELGLWLATLFFMDLPARGELLAILPLALLTGATAGAVSALGLPLVAEAGSRQLLLPAVLLPLLVPTFLAGVQASAAIVDGRPGDVVGWAAILAVEAALFLGLGLLLYDAAASPG